MGRQPKKRLDLNDLRPVYNRNDRGGLRPSAELVELATKLRIAHAIEETKDPKEQGE